MTPSDATGSAAHHYLATLLERCGRVPAATVQDAVSAPAPSLDLDWWQDGPDDFIGTQAVAATGGDDAFADVIGARIWAGASGDPASVVADATLATALAAAAAAWTDADTRTLNASGDRLRQADVGALQHIFALLGLLDGVVVHDSGPVAAALVAGLRSEDIKLRRSALALVRKFGLRSLQRDIAGLLDAPAELGHDGIEATLDALAELADGRVVRRLEEVLATRGPELSQHQAWRARHIVQVIRRAGRR